jgi:hypothetical protein
MKPEEHNNETSAASEFVTTTALGCASRISSGGDSMQRLKPCGVYPVGIINESKSGAGSKLQAREVIIDPSVTVNTQHSCGAHRVRGFRSTHSPTSLSG